jgi:hypothetical protein
MFEKSVFKNFNKHAPGFPAAMVFSAIRMAVRKKSDYMTGHSSPWGKTIDHLNASNGRLYCQGENNR